MKREYLISFVAGLAANAIWALVAYLVARL